MSLGALILTGGASSRMGEDKALQDWGGVRAVDRLVALARALGADPVFTVGGPGYGHPHVVDAQPLAGPVGGIIAGADILQSAGCDRALVLAVDAPTLTLDDLRPLLDAPPPGAAYDGFPLPMSLHLGSISKEAEAGWSIRRLISCAGLAKFPPPKASARLKGANTPAEREALNTAGPPAPRRPSSTAS